MLKNLEFATKEDLSKMLEMAIGRAFRMASLGREKEALKAADDAKEIKEAWNELELSDCLVLSVVRSIEGRSRASEKELQTVWGAM